MGIRDRPAAPADADLELVDIEDFNLPLLDEPVPPSQGKYSKAHTKAWAAKIGSFDGYVFVTPEYNHGISGALKNAIDFLYAEWNNKAAGFVGYGSAGGARAVEHLRLVMAELQVATVRAQVALSLFTDFENFTVFKPAARHESRSSKWSTRSSPGAVRSRHCGTRAREASHRLGPAQERFVIAREPAQRHALRRGSLRGPCNARECRGCLSPDARCPARRSSG